ncbi:hypothetical protein ACIB24_20525 [Spongisporangium articulatum]|uniref:DUF308 domain-containing protein n=1 Tax=Spongisporangium articulatum TaxID=3362603 RepID=A0ABW8AUZ8_9ACTN
MSDEANAGGGNGPDSGSGEPLDIDSAFAAIVADWEKETPEGERSWPADEDADLEALRALPPVTKSVPVETEGLSVVPDGERSDRSEPAEPEDTERYEPPEPPPLPRGDLISRVAWAGALGGPLFLLIAVIAWRTAPQLLLMAAIVAFVAGFVTLVARMPQHRDEDDGDGAVV